jgi:hypothetical protein
LLTRDSKHQDRKDGPYISNEICRGVYAISERGKRPILSLLSDKPQEKRAEIWQAITEEARKYADPDGSIKIDNETMCIVAERG